MNVKKDVENIGRLYEKLFECLTNGTFQAMEEEMILTAKRLLPASCISCKPGSSLNVKTTEMQ